MENSDVLNALNEISAKIDRLIIVMAMNAETEESRITQLRHGGLEWTQIGSILGIKASTARMKHTRKAQKS